MITEFYLLNYSFRYQEGITIEDLEEKIMSLSDDIEFIRKNNEKIYKHSSIYEEVLYPGLVLMDVLYYEKGSVLNRNVKKSLLKIIDRSPETSYTIEEIIELLDTHNENNIYGLLCLHKIEDIDPKYLVYNKYNWLDFHRFFLGLYPISETHFYNECIKYFENIFFHERIEQSLASLEKGFAFFPQAIIYCLAALNDKFREYYISSNLQQSLESFSSACSIETTLEGNVVRKPSFTFEFIKNQSEKENICCESHMKLSNSDASGDSKYYYNRIYFHPGKSTIYDGKILVGHIGKHL
ncbi:MAG: hypothetical protein GY754_43670 [bacterium]|nr:hypothetical protein [bacterium]